MKRKCTDTLPQRRYPTAYWVREFWFDGRLWYVPLVLRTKEFWLRQNMDDKTAARAAREYRQYLISNNA